MSTLLLRGAEETAERMLRNDPVTWVIRLVLLAMIVTCVVVVVKKKRQK